jgi:hypothetical protein
LVGSSFATESENVIGLSWSTTLFWFRKRTNSVMPSLKKNLSPFWERSSDSSILIPGLRNASSRSRLARISYWNSRVVRKISGSGLKVIFVPFFRVSPMTIIFCVVFPCSKRIW